MVWCLQFKLVFNGKPIGNNVYIFGFPAFIERKRKKERKGGREEWGRKEDLTIKGFFFLIKKISFLGVIFFPGVLSF